MTEDADRTEEDEAPFADESPAGDQDAAEPSSSTDGGAAMRCPTCGAIDLIAEDDDNESQKQGCLQHFCCVMLYFSMCDQYGRFFWLLLVKAPTNSMTLGVQLLHEYTKAQEFLRQTTLAPSLGKRKTLIVKLLGRWGKSLLLSEMSSSFQRSLSRQQRIRA